MIASKHYEEHIQFTLCNLCSDRTCLAVATESQPLPIATSPTFDPPLRLLVCFAQCVLTLHLCLVYLSICFVVVVVVVVAVVVLVLVLVVVVAVIVLRYN